MLGYGPLVKSVHITFVFASVFIQKQQQDLRRLQAVMKPSELALSLPVKSREDRMRELHEQYQRLEDNYRTVLEKLATITS